MEIFTVGGAVRDRLMGLEPKDIDYVVVGATPEDMLAQGFKQVGADFPVFLREDGTEFALARTERKSGRGYNGFETDASPSVTLRDDLGRRDLTMNAIAMDKNGAIRDPFYGRNDISMKVLRHVSPAFADDPVRVLRLARFRARYGAEWTVAPETMEFCRAMVESGELAFLTRERVFKEMEKALSEQAPHLFFSTLAACGALEVVFPELAGSRVDIEDALTMFKSASAKFNYACLTVDMTPDSVALMELRLGVPKDFSSFAVMFGRFENAPAFQHPVDILHKMDVFRQRNVWEELVEEAKAVDYGALVRFANEVYEAVKHVNFETLSEEVRATLKGPEITEAIKAQRKFAYDVSQRK